MEAKSPSRGERGRVHGGHISLVVTEGHYYNNIVKLAGKVSKVELEGSRVELKVMVRGTTSEGP